MLLSAFLQGGFYNDGGALSLFVHVTRPTDERWSANCNGIVTFKDIGQCVYLRRCRAMIAIIRSAKSYFHQSYFTMSDGYELFFLYYLFVDIIMQYNCN